VLDWELCTLGDPLADVGLLLVYWSEAGDEHTALGDSATQLPGFPTRQELIDRYAAASGRDVSNVGYYVAFGYWKLACILEGVFARYRAGAMGQADGFDQFSLQVELLARAAHDALERTA
jgi:aminoglycoside phosphotransferase (APT) family kinase protein